MTRVAAVVAPVDSVLGPLAFGMGYSTVARWVLPEANQIVRCWQIGASSGCIVDLMVAVFLRLLVYDKIVHGIYLLSFTRDVRGK